MGTSAGGDEKKVVSLSEIQKKREKKNKNNSNKDIPSIDEIENLDDPSKIPEGEARLIRDPETNEVVKVIYGTMKVNDDEDEDDELEKMLKIQVWLNN